MTTTDDLPWEERLSDRLRGAAKRTGSELAWKKAEAIEVGEWLEANDLRIHGVNTFIIDDHGVSPVIFDWDEADAGQEDERFPASPIDFIRRFTWEMIPQDEKSDPYFSFTTD